ncbi:MAG: hypothetical protein AAFX53_18885 [Bacteroidota bacterium]
MENFGRFPKDNTIAHTNWQELYVLTDHWKTDLLFYKDDLKFLNILLKKYFIWITRDDNLEAVEALGISVHRDRQKCNKLLKRIQEHLSRLVNIMEEPFKNNSVELRIKHKSLQDATAFFVKHVRENRKKVFEVTEKVMDTEHLQHTLQR